jgi:5-bromo-4-chloroindolyl phosphate hydrolysis protein
MKNLPLFTKLIYINSVLLLSLSVCNFIFNSDLIFLILGISVVIQIVLLVRALFFFDKEINKKDPNDE